MLRKFDFIPNRPPLSAPPKYHKCALFLKINIGGIFTNNRGLDSFEREHGFCQIFGPVIIIIIELSDDTAAGLLMA
jgi:hypothetical protein